MLPARLVPALCVAAIVVTGCSSQPNLENYSVGPQAHQIRVAAEAGQHLHPVVPGGSSAGSSVLPGVNYATRLDLPDNGGVEVAVSVPSGSVSPAHARWIINDYFNNDPERRTTWHGSPADLGVRPCNTPAGPCPGYQGGLQVLRGGVLYDVTIASDSSDTAWAVIRSIRIQAPDEGRRSDCHRLLRDTSAWSSLERIRMRSVWLSVTHVQANGAAGKGRVEAPQ